MRAAMDAVAASQVADVVRADVVRHLYFLLDQQREQYLGIQNGDGIEVLIDETHREIDIGSVLNVDELQRRRNGVDDAAVRHIRDEAIEHRIGQTQAVCDERRRYDDGRYLRHLGRAAAEC